MKYSYLNDLHIAGMKVFRVAPKGKIPDFFLDILP
jgi:hypothetical protein